MKESRRISKKILIAGVIEYDSIRKHLADCGYHTVEIRGKFLREKSLDEFPQFINVLLGQMSLIGPRPYLPREKEDMGDYYYDVIACKPGITGMWQSHGRSEVDFDHRLLLDEYYYRNWSFWLDVTLLFKTVKQVLYGEGAM